MLEHMSPTSPLLRCIISYFHAGMCTEAFLLLEKAVFSLEHVIYFLSSSPSSVSKENLILFLFKKSRLVIQMHLKFSSVSDTNICFYIPSVNSVNISKLIINDFLNKGLVNDAGWGAFGA